MTVSEVSTARFTMTNHLHSVEMFLKPPTNDNNRKYNSALVELDQDRQYFQRLTPYLRAAMKGALTPIITDVLTNKFNELKLDSWFNALMEKIEEDWDKSMDLMDRSWEVQNDEVDVIAVRQEVKDVFMGVTEEEGEVDRNAIYMSSPELHSGPETPEEELPEFMVFESIEGGSESMEAGRDSSHLHFDVPGFEIPAPTMEINMEDPSDIVASPESVSPGDNNISPADLSNSSEISGDLGLSNPQGPTNSETHVLRDLVIPSSFNSTMSKTPQIGARNGIVSYASGPLNFEEMNKENTPTLPQELEGAEVNSIDTPPRELNPEQMMRSLRV